MNAARLMSARKPAEKGGTACQLDLDVILPGETDEVGRFQKLEQLIEAKTGITDVHVRRDDGHAEVCVHYDDKQLKPAEIVALVRSTGSEVAERYRHKTWFVRGMDSAQSGYVIEHVLERMPGVLDANVAYAAERLVVEYDKESVKPREIEAKVRALGYELEEPEPGHVCSHHANKGGLAPKLEMPLVIIAGVLLAVGFLLREFTELPGLASDHAVRPGDDLGRFLCGPRCIDLVATGHR